MHNLRLDGAEKILWEPLWKLEIPLSPLEQALLSTSPLRRLHHLAHSGSSSILTGHTQSRLQHTLGVFALVAYFQPDNVLLRIAALLHDVGHYPFSHTLEQLPGIDHHRLTLERLHTAPIAPLLQSHGVEPELVVQFIEGDPPSPLRNQSDALHADHLDAWARGAQSRGQLDTSANILSHLRLIDGYLETNRATADYLVELITLEAHFHASAADLGSSALIERLTSSLLKADTLTLNALADMTDAELSFHLLNSPQTSAEARRLWFGPGHLTVSREVETEGISVEKDKFYLSLPRVDGKPADSPRIRELLASVEELRGTYVIHWEPNG